MDQSAPYERSGGFFSSRWNIGVVVFLIVAGFYLLAEYKAHVFSDLPFLLFLACVLMHLFMHGRRGGHGGRRETLGENWSASGQH